MENMAVTRRDRADDCADAGDEGASLTMQQDSLCRSVPRHVFLLHNRQYVKFHSTGRSPAVTRQLTDAQM